MNRVWYAIAQAPIPQREEWLTLEEGPPGIETQRDVDGVVAPLVRLISEREKQHGAFVIACFSDPALHSAREVTRKLLHVSKIGMPSREILPTRLTTAASVRRCGERSRIVQNIEHVRQAATRW